MKILIQKKGAGDSQINEEQQTSTKVEQIEEPIQQKRDIRPISSARSLFCKRLSSS